MPCGGGIFGGQTHSQKPDAMFTHVCGLRTVMLSNPYDAKGLLIGVDGADLTVLTFDTMELVSEAAAAESGVDAEIIDLRSLWPLDLAAIITSVKKTGRCVAVHEATRTSVFGTQPAARRPSAVIRRVAGSWPTGAA